MIVTGNALSGLDGRPKGGAVLETLTGMKPGELGQHFQAIQVLLLISIVASVTAAVVTVIRR